MKQITLYQFHLIYKVTKCGPYQL